MPLTFLDDAPAKPQKSGLTFLDDEPDAPPAAVAPAAPPVAAPPVEVEEDAPAPPSNGFIASAQAAAAQGTLNTAAAVVDVLPSGVVSANKPLNPADQPRWDALNAERDEIENVEARMSEGGGGTQNPRLRAISRELLSLSRPPVSETLPGQLRNAAGEAFDYYNADPKAKNALAQIGRGVGSFGANAPAMALNLPLAAVQMAGTAYQSAYGQKEKELRDSGETNESAIADQAGTHAGLEAVKSVPQLAAFTVGGKLASGAVATLLKGASPLAKGIAGTAAGSAANVGVGAGTRWWEGGEAMPNLEQLTQDVLFGVVHGTGEYRNATAEAKQKAAVALQKRAAQAAEEAGMPAAAQAAKEAADAPPVAPKQEEAPVEPAPVEAKAEEAPAPEPESAQIDKLNKSSISEVPEEAPRAGEGMTFIPEAADELAKVNAPTPEQYQTAADETWRGTADTAPEPTPAEARNRIISAYQELKAETGFPAVPIADVAERAGLPLDAQTKGHVADLFQQGDITSLSHGDWSLADPRKRAWGVRTAGDIALLMRMGDDVQPSAPEARGEAPSAETAANPPTRREPRKLPMYHDDLTYSVIHPSAKNPGMFQVTNLEKETLAPVGDTQHPTLEDAVHTASFRTQPFEGELVPVPGNNLRHGAIGTNAAPGDLARIREMQNSGETPEPVAPVATPEPERAPETPPEAVPVRAVEEAVGSDIPHDPFDDHPLISALVEHGGLLSKTAAKQKWSASKWERNQGEWDDAATMANPKHNKLFSRDGLQPDEAAQVLVDAGLLPHGANAHDMWEALRNASESAERQRKDMAAQGREHTTLQKQHDAFEKDRAIQDPGDREFTSWDLSEGDVLKVGEEEMTVISTDADSVTLEDGKKYGRQVIESGQVIYGKLRSEDGKFRNTEAEKTAEPKATPAEPAAPETGESGEGPTGLRNSIIDANRARMGLPERVKPGRRSDERLMADAKAILSRDPTAGQRLVNELIREPRALKDTEHALILHEQVTRENEVDAALQAVIDARNGDPVVKADAKERLQRAREDMRAYDDAEQKSGTLEGRALRARQLLMNRDYSLARMHLEYEAEHNNGEPLNEAQAAHVQKLHDEIKGLKEKLSKYDERDANAEAGEVFQKLIAELRNEAKAEAKQGGDKANFLERKANEARNRLRMKLRRTNAGVDVTIIVDLSIIGSDYVAKGVRNLADFTTRMVGEFGEKVREYMPEVFKQAQAYHDANDRLFGGGTKKRAETPEEVLSRVDAEDVLDPKLVFDLARAYVRAGTEGMENVLGAVHKDLEPSFPGLTEREVMEAFSGYGKVTYPSKADDLTKLREYKALARLTLQLQDAQNRIPPKRTGPQRDKPSEKVRTLQKQVAETMRRLGIETTSKEQQLKTSLDAVKTRLRNEIEDMVAAIASKTPRVTPGREVQYDAETKELIRQRDAKRAEYDAIFKKPGITDEQRIEVAMKSLNRSIAEELQMFEEGTLKRDKGEGKTPSTPELERRRAVLEQLRDTRRELYAQANPGKSTEEIALEAATKAAKASIDRYDQMLKTGKLDPAKPAPPYTVTNEIEALRSERDAMRDAVLELRKEAMPRTSAEERARKATLKALEKSIAHYDKRLLANDFSAKGKKVIRPETQRVSELREIRDTMRQTFNELRKASIPKRSPDEIQLARDMKAIQTRIDKLQAKIAVGDYTPDVKRAPLEHPDKTALQYKLHKAQEEWNRGLFAARLRNRTKWQKVGGMAGEAVNTSRAIMTSIDASGVLRQGGFIALGHPIRAAKAIPAMIQAFRSEPRQFKINQEIRDRPNAPLYAKAGLYINDERAMSLSQMEEAYMSRWAKKIPIVAGSERAYTTFLNKLRADSFDAMAANLARNGNPTLVEAKAIANFINVATGRGELGKAAPAAVGLNTFFFAPRYVVSRFQLLAFQPLYGGTARTRGLIVQEYGRYLAGAAVVYSLAMLAQNSDDDKPNTDPLSSEFGRVTFGNTRLDPMSGLIQVTTFAAREGDSIRRWVKQYFTGEEEEKPDYRDGGTVLVRFLRTKLSPLIGTLFSAVTHKDVNSREFTPADAAKQLAAPISVGDILKTMEAQGVPKGLALSILSFFGMGVQTYTEDE